MNSYTHVRIMDSRFQCSNLDREAQRVSGGILYVGTMKVEATHRRRMGHIALPHRGARPRWVTIGGRAELILERHDRDITAQTDRSRACSCEEHHEAANRYQSAFLAMMSHEIRQ